MSGTFNLYCDESCHLPHDRQPLMVLGVVSCPAEKAREVAVRLREIEQAHSQRSPGKRSAPGALSG
ncbi:hypothetical protein GCM10007167_21280 [Vulcaniibacterium thermophilum]|uniref:DUF3800 domain-containing protein n=1 Tax=Vulcaniibacterium thermophilum TaxID=1169913 RepID=A0A918Z6K7_9GAMM|nr:hypothetical protein GCM10007167_21280 [Vulcaniibacterium thermophilum]